MSVSVANSEVFGQREDHLKDKRDRIMKELLAQLNQRSAAQPAWRGMTDVHYIFLWNSNTLSLLDYEVVIKLRYTGRSK